MKLAVDIKLRGLARIQHDSIKVQTLIKATNKKSKITRENIMRMIINMYFTIINKNVNMSYCIGGQKAG